METLVQPCELHLDGGEGDLQQLAHTFTAEVVKVGRSAHRLVLDNEWAHGYAMSLGMPLGARLSVHDLKGRTALALPIRHAPSELEFSFCRGTGTSARTAQGQALAFSGAQMRVGCVNETTLLDYQAEAGANQLSIHVSVSAESLRELLGTDELPEAISTLISAPGQLNFLETHMDASSLGLTDEIFDVAAQVQGQSEPGRLLYLQAKTMELLAVGIERAAGQCHQEPPLPEYDRRALYRAREILIENLDNPPSVINLAKRVALGEKRLKSGFKQLFGSPVMSYHRQLKMERARELLVAREYNVTEVAALIGYANPSKFAAAYRRAFGESPSFALTGTG